MNKKKLHYFSGITIAIFITLHLINHLCSLVSIDKHIEVMQTFRLLYRNVLAETVLVLAVVVQIVSGWSLFKAKRKNINSQFDKLQIWSGLYLAVFFLIHVGAVFTGRFVLKLDTNVYFGVAGLNVFPFNLFFIPYYALAIISFFSHMAAVHSKKAKHSIMGLTPAKQAMGIVIVGVIISFLTIYGLTNKFKGVAIPQEYKVLVGG